MEASRRKFLKSTAATAAGIGAWAAMDGVAPQDAAAGRLDSPAAQQGWPGGREYRPVVTPNGAALPFKLVAGVKVFHLIAEPVLHEFTPGLKAHCWGYNGRVHGPTIEAVEGDRVRIYVTNRLPTSTTVHWHGLRVPSGMDGVGGLSQRTIESGETFKYEFTLEQHGTFMYHSHHDEMTQMAMGLMGMFVIHPKDPGVQPPDRDFVFLLSEWSIKPGTQRPDPNEMTDFNVLTFNAKVFPATDPMVVATGERVRIRIGNLSAMDHHPIHLHGYNFRIVETDGGPLAPSAQWPETSVLVPVGSTRTLEFVADAPGDWAMHCHMTHHVMTQMGHGIPNLIGIDPSEIDERLTRVVPEYASMGSEPAVGAQGGEDIDHSIPRNSVPMMGGAGPFGYITMGGMFTILKVREQIAGPTDGGWYKNPPGTVADLASDEDLKADGIQP